jgi:hypothetical protein
LSQLDVRGACGLRWVAAAAAACAVLAGCSSSTAPAVPVALRAQATTHAHAQHAASAPALSPGSQLPWKPVGSVVHGVHATYLTSLDKGRITLLWINPRVVSFRFIPGTQIPEKSPSRSIDNQPSTWVPRMVAAFNGGFWLKDLHPGGYFYAGKVVKPLVVGVGALAVTATGRLTVGMWGRDLQLGPDVVAVRENLPLLVDGSRDRTSAMTGRGAWGGTTNGALTANRSALGELPNGSLVYEYGYRVTPEQMAAGLIRAGARTAIMLDMNGSWPGAFVYIHHVGRISGMRINSRIYHQPSLYYTRYRKDFIVALA